MFLPIVKFLILVVHISQLAEQAEAGFAEAWIEYRQHARSQRKPGQQFGNSDIPLSHEVRPP
jgi:hypothetical protein